MKKTLLILCLVIFSITSWSKNVSQQEAAKVAVSFYRINNPMKINNPALLSSTEKSSGEIICFYIFRFSPAGFVLVSADDAVIPVLGYSFENDMPENITDPSLNEWFNDYCREISYIISHNTDNSQTLMQWNDIRNEVHPSRQALDVSPLLNTTWDQGCFYNALCPSASLGQCGHVWTGCVATAMTQIMKFHNFPPRGIGQHTYTDANYGVQSADYENTIYDWSSMPNSVGSSNNAVATIMYHAGVSVDMMYDVNGSGAYSENVPDALLDYFNYNPEIDIRYKDDYANVEDFKTLLRTDLDAGLPIYYSGSSTTDGHAWVCDGYRMSDGKFHFNWGWSGSSNGYYAIGALNPSGYTFNLNNTVVIHIKPNNPDLIVRITHPDKNALFGVGYPVEINAKVLRGSADMMKIFIDDVEKFSAGGDSISYTWNTNSNDLGSHIVKAYAYNSTDTVYYKEMVNVAEWISQASGFSTPARALTYLSAVDSNIVWGTAADGNNLTGACSDFTRTTDGGNTWTPGTINGTAGLSSAMIFALDSSTAYTAMYKVSGNSPMGVYMTSDGGITWTRQATALFNNSASFPNVVHFFNTTDGMAMGDPVNGKFEIYTTTNGGANWTLIPGSGNPAPLSGEFGVVGYYSAVHDTIWFGTNKGRVYKSADKGISWTATSAPGMSAAYVKPVFRNGTHGLLLDESTGGGLLCESSDGGVTWTPVTYSGPNYAGDLAYVPGTTDTWVRSASSGSPGCAFSFDGGHTWTDFIGTAGSEYFQMTWVNNHCGWSGGKNSNPDENGVYKFIGKLQPALPAPQNVQTDATGHEVTVTWVSPVYNPGQMSLLGYNLYRNGTRLNISPVTSLSYIDYGVPSAQYTYCVRAEYNMGESPDSCSTVDVGVGITNQLRSSLSIFPNPAHGSVFVKTTEKITGITIQNQGGIEIPVTASISGSDAANINISKLQPGIYVITVITSGGVGKSKLIVY